MAGSGFSHAIAGGDGKLVIVALQSPNFIHGVQGWSINKDGSAEFQDVIIPDAGGTVVTFAPTAPSSPNIDDLWYNTDDGLAVSQWDGSAWVPYQIGTGAIAGGAVTPALQAAGDSVNPNSYFSGGDTSSWQVVGGGSPPGVLAGTATPGGFQYPWCGQFTAAAGSSFPGVTGLLFPVNVGDPVQVNGWLASNTAGAYFQVNFWDSAGGFVGDIENDFGDTSGVFGYLALVGTVPSGAVSASLGYGVNTAAAAGTETVSGTGLVVMTKVNGALIETGTLAVLQYNGTPGAGNLVSSDAGPTGGTDQFGNAYLPGFTVYGPNGECIQLVAAVSGVPPQILLTPGSVTHMTLAGQIFCKATNAGAANEFQQATFSSGKSGNADAAIQLFGQSADGTIAPQAVVEFGGTVVLTVSLTQITTTVPILADTWHNITLDSGWTAGAAVPQYRLLPDGNVQVRGQATHAGITAATNINGSTPLGSPYHPAQTRIYRPPDAGDAAATVDITTTGVFVARASGFTATAVILDGMYSL